jgi:cobalt-zinc-cadmium efflux system outer membrane protein
MPSEAGRASSLRKKPMVARFFLRWFSAAAINAGHALVPYPARAAEPLDELEATRSVCAAGPCAALARAQRLGGAAEVIAADVLPNPSLVAQHQQSLRGPTERESVVGLSVPLGIGGRRSLRKEAANEKQGQARANAEATLFESALAFREAYVKAATDQARVEVLAEQQMALEGLSATIQGLAKGGEAAGYDLLRQQALSRLHGSSLESARAQALAARALLEAWLESEVTLRPAEPAPSHGGGTVASFSEGAVPGSARIRSLEAAARASETEARAARRRWVPDLDLFAGYRQLTSGPETGHGISLGLTVPLTFFDHGQGEAARAEAERDIASAMALKLRREQRAELKAARLRLKGLVAALAQAERASADASFVQSKARQLYAAGEATITELLDAFRGAEEARLARVEVTHQIASARLALMHAAGTMFDPALDRACRGAPRGAR